MSTGIPQVGYLTTFDDWIFVMYTTLAMCVVLHQIVIVLKRKTDSIPLRSCAIRVIEFIGRMLFAPLSCIYYMITFMNPTIEAYATYLSLIIGFMIFIGAREWGGVRKSFVVAANSIQDKLDEGAKTTRFERFMMNFISYRKFSMSIKHYKARLSRKRRSEFATKRDIEMRERRNSELQEDSDDEN